MTLKVISRHPTIDSTTAPNPKTLAMGRAIFTVIAGTLLLATGVGAQTSEVRTDARTAARTDAPTDSRSESRPEPRPDSAIESQRAAGAMDHHQPGWHKDGHRHGHGHGDGQGQGPRHPMMGWMLGRLDTDRDGAISRAELEAEHQRHVALFDQADADHDGKLTADELHAVHAVHARHRKDRRPEHRREGRTGPSPRLESPTRPSQGGEPAR